MARIAGVNIPDRKHVWVALTHVYGIGRTGAFEICTATGIAPDVAVRSLTEAELDALRSEVAKRVTEGDLRREVFDEHQAVDGSWMLSGNPPSPRIAGTWPANSYERSHQKGPS